MDSKYNKAYAVGQYAHALWLAVGEMMQRWDHKDYTWNSGNANNPHRIEMLEAIHQRAMKAIDSLND